MTGITCTIPQWLAHGRELVRQHPLERVNVIGIVLTEVPSESGTSRDWAYFYPWTFLRSDRRFEHDSERYLPWCIFDCLPDGVFRTRADAMDGLSEACLLWAREEPATVKEKR